MKTREQQNTMKRTPNNFGPMPVQILPGDPVTIWLRRVDRRLVPALAALMAPAVSNGDAGSPSLFPIRTIFVTSNEDGTFEVISNLQLIAAEASRMTDSDVTVAEVVFDPDDLGQEDRLRSFLAFIDPFRSTVTRDDLLKAVDRGDLDELLARYAGDRVHPRNHRAVQRLLGTQKFPSSTFHRIRNEIAGSTSKKRVQVAKLAEGDAGPVSARGSAGGARKPRKSVRKVAKPKTENAKDTDTEAQNDLFGED